MGHLSELGLAAVHGYNAADVCRNTKMFCTCKECSERKFCRLPALEKAGENCKDVEVVCQYCADYGEHSTVMFYESEIDRGVTWKECWTCEEPVHLPKK